MKAFFLPQYRLLGMDTKVNRTVSTMMVGYSRLAHVKLRTLLIFPRAVHERERKGHSHRHDAYVAASESFFRSYLQPCLQEGGIKHSTPSIVIVETIKCAIRLSGCSLLSSRK